MSSDYQVFEEEHYFTEEEWMDLGFTTDEVFEAALSKKPEERDDWRKVAREELDDLADLYGVENVRVRL